MPQEIWQKNCEKQNEINSRKNEKKNKVLHKIGLGD
jgi:hypothetical protein